MSKKDRIPALDKIKPRFRDIVEKEGLLDVDVLVLAKPLTAEESIGTPGRRDFPIIIGKERILEAIVQGSRGHAFTDSAREFTGTLKEILDLELTTNQNRAIYVATLNAVLAHLKMATGTVHCKDEDPEKCAHEIARHLHETYGEVNVGLIGLNPAIAERVIETFGTNRVRISDLDSDNIGKNRFGVDVWDGNTQNDDLIEESQVIVFTGTTLLNDTFDHIWNALRNRNKDYLVFGVTAAGVKALLGFERICPFGQDG